LFIQLWEQLEREDKSFNDAGIDRGTGRAVLCCQFPKQWAIPPWVENKKPPSYKEGGF